MSPETRALPFVLRFANLTYNVKMQRKLKIPGITTHNLSPGEQFPGGFFSRTKTLLNDICGEARDGEVMAVLGASGSGKVNAH
uniref:Uncharacterized protein n=1 Tax=Chenopodium quinoa TaxID=63459 RepID=A0A803N9N6_CHEQI